MAPGTQRKRIGDTMVELGLIRREWVPAILEYAQEKKLRFGEAANRLGYIREEDLKRALRDPYRKQPYFNLDASRFPKTTREAIPLNMILKEGMLPLGSKKRFRWFRALPMLNVGLLDPRKEIDEKALLKDQPQFRGIERFQVLPDQFLEVLATVYGITSAQLLKFDPTEIDERLLLYIQLDVHPKPLS